MKMNCISEPIYKRVVNIIHSHDCNEYTTVLKGHLIDLITKKTYIEGETVVYLV
jgi:hypothetical protein